MGNAESSSPELYSTIATPKGPGKTLKNAVNGLVAGFRGNFNNTQKLERDQTSYYEQSMMDLKEVRETTSLSDSIDHVLRLEHDLMVLEDRRKEELLSMSENQVFDIKNRLCEEKEKQIKASKKIGGDDASYNQQMVRLKRTKETTSLNEGIGQILALEENLGVLKSRRKEELLSMNADQILAIKDMLCDEAEEQIETLDYKAFINRFLIEAGVKSELVWKNTDLLFDLLDFEKGKIALDKDIVGKKNNITEIVNTFTLSVGQKRKLALELHYFVDINYQHVIKQDKEILH